MMVEPNRQMPFQVLQPLQSIDDHCMELLPPSITENTNFKNLQHFIMIIQVLKIKTKKDIFLSKE